MAIPRYDCSCNPPTSAPEEPLETQDKWTHRSTGLRCRTCLWWVRKEDARLALISNAETLGRCRRHAPTLSGWPVVYAVDWCGDHKLDGGKL